MLGDSLSQIHTENMIRVSRDKALVWKPWVTLIVALLTGNRTACSVIGSSLLNTTETDWAKTLNQSGLILGIIQVLHKTFIKKKYYCGLWPDKNRQNLEGINLNMTLQSNTF